MLLEEARVLPQLKQTLGHFDFPNNGKQFRDTAHSSVKELVSTLWEPLRSGEINQRILAQLAEGRMIMQLFHNVAGR